MQAHHRTPLVTQLLDYANLSPKLWPTFTLKTNHHKLLSNLPNVISIHIKLDRVVEPDHLLISLLELHAWIKDEADYQK